MEEDLPKLHTTKLFSDAFYSLIMSVRLVECNASNFPPKMSLVQTILPYVDLTLNGIGRKKYVRRFPRVCT